MVLDTHYLKYKYFGKCLYFNNLDNNMVDNKKLRHWHESSD